MWEPHEKVGHLVGLDEQVKGHVKVWQGHSHEEAVAYPAILCQESRVKESVSCHPIAEAAYCCPMLGSLGLGS